MYPNLLLLCPDHHKLIDDNPGEYTVERLQRIKQEHEEWVAKRLTTFDAVKQRDDERYASYVEEWAKLGDVAHWEQWSSFVFGSGIPKLHRDRYQSLAVLNDYLFKRIWPKRYSELEDAFTNFRRVLQDFLKVFMEHVKDEDSDVLWTDRFYKIQRWDPKLYTQLLNRFEHHVELVLDLMVELTRAANRLCDKVRQYVDPSFRIHDGVLVVNNSDFLGYDKLRAEYATPSEQYPGHQKFLTERGTRTQHFGEGLRPL